ncbi:MAG: AAA family ATPase [Kocuria sp.]|nr:AAA family ATPase [Kocuria sp.]
MTSYQSEETEDVGMPPDPAGSPRTMIPDRARIAVREPQSTQASVQRSAGDSPLGRKLVEENQRRARLQHLNVQSPDQTRVFTISNQKGGVGKTSTSVNLAVALAKHGQNVLVIDNDPQGNASTALGVPHSTDVNGVYDVLVDEMPLKDVVVPSPEHELLVVAPATIDLAGAEIELVSMVAREQRLSRAIAQYQKDREENGLARLDYIFIDCPPSLGLLTINAFVAATEVLIPIQCEYYALEGLSQLINNITMIQKHLNPELKMSTIMMTMYDGRTNLASQVAEEVRSHFPEQVLETMIPRSVRISEAPSYQQSVITYDPQSTGALAYLEAAAEIAYRGAPAG